MTMLTGTGINELKERFEQLFDAKQDKRRRRTIKIDKLERDAIVDALRLLREDK